MNLDKGPQCGFEGEDKRNDAEERAHSEPREAKDTTASRSDLF
jgi:hypothetical protein